jgi:predicted dehydrogenase
MSNPQNAKTPAADTTQTPGTGWSRRRFLNTAAGAGALALGARHIAAQDAKPGRRILGANDKIVMGIIGAGGMGRGHMENFKDTGGMEWAAVCDVYKPHLEEGLKIAGDKAKGYAEHERILERKDIDAVLIASPEHWHHDHLIAAVAAGKDAYSEKPMCHNIQEGQEMIAAVRKTDCIVQIGMQRRSSPIIRDEVKKIFEEGKLGKIHMVRAEWYWNWKVDANTEAEKDKLDWKRFCGPAGEQEYNPVKYRYWRYYWPFSGGNETDQGTHLMDVVQWMMGVDKPKSAVQWGNVFENHPTETPDTFCCTFEYPDFMCTWTLGYTTNTWFNGWSITFQGTQGALFLTETGYRMFNQVNGWEKGWPKPAKQALPGSVTSTVPHIKNFLECVRSRQQPNAPVEIGHVAVRPLHLANAALKANRRAILEDDGTTIRLA